MKTPKLIAAFEIGFEPFYESLQVLIDKDRPYFDLDGEQMVFVSDILGLLRNHPDNPNHKSFGLRVQTTGVLGELILWKFLEVPAVEAKRQFRMGLEVGDLGWDWEMEIDHHE